MNKPLNILLCLFLLAMGACENPQQAPQPENMAANPTDSALLSYFVPFSESTVKIDAEQYYHPFKFEAEQCLPLSLMRVLNNHLEPTQMESTGALPIGVFQLDSTNHILVVAQETDYGPTCTGLKFNSKRNLVEQHEQLASVWGDGGDSQVTYSVLTFGNKAIKIDKYIETCHADLEVDAGAVVETDVQCFDSTAVIVLK